jgi:hypothetical protein
MKVTKKALLERAKSDKIFAQYLSENHELVGLLGNKEFSDEKEIEITGKPAEKLAIFDSIEELVNSKHK